MKNNQTNNNGITKTIVCAAALALAGLTACIASQETQSIVATMGKGSGSGCIGTYYAVAQMTNNLGLFLITPPTGTTNGIFQDISGFPAPYASAMVVIRSSDLKSWCTNSTNGVSFPATSSDSYQMTVYVNSKTPPPSSGQTMKLQVTWQP
jgi:hypothetical protein